MVYMGDSSQERDVTMTGSMLPLAKLLSRSALACVLAAGAIGCSRPNSNSDQTVAGAVLGAGWGAGAGAVIGNQVSSPGQGAAVGAGFGLVSGAMVGYSNDRTEDSQAKLEKQLASLKIQSLTNQRQLQDMQVSIDNGQAGASASGLSQVFFDDDASSLRSGSIANLETIADSLRTSLKAFKIKVVGHSDDAGTPDYNLRLSEARARTVASYLAARGISMDQISIESRGSTQPLLSNTTAEGRQMNRRVDIFVSR
jgi:outer membrane protein OmpA-like peptidoglycan-associated protein